MLNNFGCKLEYFLNLFQAEIYNPTATFACVILCKSQRDFNTNTSACVCCRANINFKGKASCRQTALLQFSEPD